MALCRFRSVLCLLQSARLSLVLFVRIETAIHNRNIRKISNHIYIAGCYRTEKRLRSDVIPVGDAEIERDRQWKQVCISIISSQGGQGNKEPKITAGSCNPAVLSVYY